MDDKQTRKITEIAVKHGISFEIAKRMYKIYENIENKNFAAAKNNLCLNWMQIRFFVAQFFANLFHH